MRFRNFGGIYQFVVTGEADLARIDALDPARWAATSAPLADLHCDPRFLSFLDPDATGRIRVGQLVAARDWLFARLAQRDALGQGTDAITLDALDTETRDGRALRAAAERVIREQDLQDPTRIDLASVRAFKARYHELLANGDGIIPPELAPEADLQDFLRDVIRVVGAERDRGGADGVGATGLARFLEKGREWLAWRAKAASVRPWGDDTEAAAALVAKLDPKVEEYFLHCELLRQAAPSPQAWQPTDEELRVLRRGDAASIAAHLTGALLHPPLLSATLPLTGPVNEAWRADLEALRTQVLARALGDEVHDLGRDAWRKVRALFEPFTTWQHAAPTEPFGEVGEARLAAWLTGDAPARLEALIVKDREAAPELERIDELEKLLLYVRWLVELANNFVNFSAIYRPGVNGLMESGSLVIDGRRLDFCLRVTDRARHRAIARESQIFLVYASVAARDGAAPAYEIVAPLTGGERGHLRVGRRGLFIDIDGCQWDAVVVDLVENPVSVREAAIAPFRRAARSAAQRIEAWVGARRDAHERVLLESTERLPGRSAPRPEGAGLDVNSLVLGGGMALAGLGAVVAGLFSALTSLRGWLAVLGIAATVMSASALLGWIRLRTRDLSLLLEANGWSVNTHMILNARIASLFAFTPPLPREAILEREDLLPATVTELSRRRSLRYVFLLLFVTAATAATLYLSTRKAPKVLDPRPRVLAPLPGARPPPSPTAQPR